MLRSLMTCTTSSEEWNISHQRRRFWHCFIFCDYIAHHGDQADKAVLRESVTCERHMRARRTIVPTRLLIHRIARLSRSPDPPSQPSSAQRLRQQNEFVDARAHRRRPRRPPFLRVLSDGVGVTSSMRPIFMPERARARRADWAPGPGVLVPLPDGLSASRSFVFLLQCDRDVPPVARILT